jgi:hypothetical protein
MVAALETRGDDADNPRMPAECTNDDCGVFIRVAGIEELGLGFHQDFVFDRAALAVLLIERCGEEARSNGIIGEQELERGFGGGETAGGIEPGAEAKTDVGRE